MAESGDKEDPISSSPSSIGADKQFSESESKPRNDDSIQEEGSGREEKEEQTTENPDVGEEEKQDPISSKPSSDAADEEISVSESSRNDDSIQEKGSGKEEKEEKTTENPDVGEEEKQDPISSNPSSDAAGEEISVSESSRNQESVHEENAELNLIDRLPYNRSSSKERGSLPSNTTEPIKLQFLFEMTLLNHDPHVLNIPEDVALAHFPAITLIDNKLGDIKTVSILDFQTYAESNREWIMKFFYCSIHKSYAIVGDWKLFDTLYKLDAGDVLHFHRKEHTSTKYYILRVTKKYGYGLVCLLKKELTQSDVSIKSLQLPNLEGDKYFSCVKNGNGSSDKEEDVILVSDAEKGMWPMGIKFIPTDGYLISGSWSEFVSAHDLKATDVIRFYKVVENEENDRHYLIDYVRAKDAAETSKPTPPPEPGNNGGGCSGDCYKYARKRSFPSDSDVGEGCSSSSTKKHG